MEVFLFFTFILFSILLVLVGKKIGEPILSVIAGWIMLLPIIGMITGGYQQSFPTTQIVNASYSGSNLLNATIITKERLATTQNDFTFAFGLLLVGVMVIIMFYGLKPSAHNREGG